MDLLPAFLILMAASGDALAQVGSRHVDLASAMTYAWLVIMGVIGGLVSFYQKVKAGATRWLNINELIGELFTSGFVGLVTGLLCEAGEFSLPLTFALVGITGHMGGRAIFVAERLGQKWAEKKLGIAVPAEEIPAEPDKPVITKSF